MKKTGKTIHHGWNKETQERWSVKSTNIHKVKNFKYSLSDKEFKAYHNKEASKD